MSQINAGDPICLGPDGLAYPAKGNIGFGNIIGFASPKDTEDIDKIWVKMIASPTYGEERLFVLGSGYWIGPEPPQGDPIYDETLLDAVDWYLGHK